MTYFIKAFKTLLVSIFIMGLSLGFGGAAQATQSEAVDTGKVTAQLVSSHARARAGETIWTALRTELDDGWHTYWRNPGDSGEEVQMRWTLPEGASAGEIVWPLPDAIPTGPLINYGFEGVPYFPVQITLPASAKDGDIIPIAAKVYYLVCKDVCIPESGDLSMSIEIGEPQKTPRWDALITRALGSAPKESTAKAGIVKTGDIVEFTFSNLPKGDFSEAFFFPNDLGLIAPSAPQTLTLGSGGVSITTAPEYLWDAEMENSYSGTLRYIDSAGEPSGIIVNAAVGQAQPIGVGSSGGASTGVSSLTLWGAIFGAFIGGLILNLMPCVFPIISMKALSLAKSAHSERAAMRREGWLYTAGVLLTFLILVAVLLALKAAGSEIGWGFQLQSPIVVGILALLLFAIGLNLLGLFEFGTGLQNTGSDLVSKGGNSGAFFTGVLAVIVATPCTAPFMAGAIGYALSQPALIAIAVFMALAIGFALPFLALAYAPQLLAKLPKPGPWMVRFRELLAFPMLAASIWLIWVLSLQAGADGILRILLAMLALSFAIWGFKRTGALARGLAILSLLAALALPLGLSIDTSAQGSALASKGYDKMAWSPETVTERLAAGQNVFVDFTAAWCVTCKVNERAVLARQDVKTLFKDSNTVFLVADWTNKNDQIAQELARHGRSGVPLYLVYRADNKDVNPQVLPQVLSETVLRTALLGN